MLGWFIEQRPSRVTAVFGAIIGRAEGEHAIPREYTVASLRSSIEINGGFEGRIEQLDVLPTEVRNVTRAR